MAIEKMHLVKIRAHITVFDKLLWDICVQGVFQPENAVHFYPDFCKVEHLPSDLINNEYPLSFNIDSAKEYIKSFAVYHQQYVYLAGWVEKRQSKVFCQRLSALDKSINVEYTKPNFKMDVTPPVKIARRSKMWGFFINPYKFYVDMYGSLSYYDLDITPFVAITYTVFFGMMFGDMGQGFVLAIAGFVMWRFKKMDVGKILVPCGISSILFGFVFGSVFGYEHLLDKLYVKLGIGNKPIEVMESVNRILLISISAGICLVCVAIVINILGCIKRRCFVEALFSNNGVTGLILYLFGVNFISTFLSGPALEISKNTYVIVIIVCAGILLLKDIPLELFGGHNTKKRKGIADFLLQNLFEFLEYILSYMSNTLSFLRIGAFILVHSGMMMVVFSLAGEKQNLLVIALGNVVVIALEGLLVGIQALRLEYYEMFNRFFVGGGVPFKPIKLTRNTLSKT